ncbi:MAG: dihydropteroate synthase [Gemmatimonadota bacterium]|nr:dihydropteroate synthase [Gemmatimonadota bacterium]
MNARALALHSPRAVREALIAAGWDAVRADAAAEGSAPAALQLTGLELPALVALVRYTQELGIDLVTGDDWALLSGSRARLGALARPWTVPPELAGIAEAVGTVLAPSPPTHWLTATGSIALDQPVIVGILNVTPDSFSDGGRFVALDEALAHADRLVAEGAAVLDVGGESTRPGNEPVSEAEEIRRVAPVIEALAKRHASIPLSVDTVKAAVARAALSAGASIVNDVSSFRLDPAMASVAAAGSAGVILMHSRGSVATMARLDHAQYPSGVATEIVAELRLAVDAAVTAGITPDRIVVDPGFGFAKSAEQNLELTDGLAALAVLGRPVLVGPSRKRFLGSVTGRDAPDRDVATAAACVVAYERGARLFRVHNIAATRDALAVAHAVRHGH